LPPGSATTGRSSSTGATAQGRLTPRQGLAFSTMLEFRRRALDTIEYEARLNAIEEGQSRADRLKEEFKAKFMSR
jgi:hypothetical protein